MKTALLLVSMVLLFSCGPSVYIDFEKDQDFSEYNSYRFYPDIDSGLNEFDDKRIKFAIDSVLQQRGFTKTSFNRFYINFYASESVSNSRSTIGIGVGGGGRNGGIGVSGGIPIGGRTINQQLTIDIIDAHKNQELVWQAVIDGELKEKATPRQKEAYYYKVLEKALKKFPPQNKIL
ncbi:MAG: DUF4136 domain-containing protein [Flavobacteriaceae bacterium]|nr:DUF4136 domain-containing protein [Flavobacteriaceae bacterium]